MAGSEGASRGAQAVATPYDDVSTPLAASEAPASEVQAAPSPGERGYVTAPPSTSARSPDDEEPEQVWSYADGSLSAWSEVHVFRPEQVRVVDDPVRPGYASSGSFTAGPADHTFDNTTTIRGEVRSTVAEAGWPSEGDVQWYSWSTYFPEDFLWDGETQVLTYTQWHQTANYGPPNIALSVTDGQQPRVRMSLAGGLLGDEAAQYSTTYDLGPLVRGAWLDHTVRIAWSADPGAGSVMVWINGEQKVHAVAANFYPNRSVYLKQGVYAANNTTREHTVYFSDTLRGNSRESVALETAGG